MPTTLITGANRGIGLALTEVFAARGWRVIATARSPDQAHELARVAGEVAIYRMDVTNDAEVRSVVQTLGEQPLDLVINNAGVGARQGRNPFPTGHPALDAVDLGDWEEVMRVNAIAPFRVACAFLPGLRRGDGRKLVGISSGMGSIGDNRSGGYYAYRASKAALNMTMRGLAQDLAGDRIIAVAVESGWVRTDMGGTGAPTEPAQAAAELFELFVRLRPADSGKFLAGMAARLPW